MLVHCVDLDCQPWVLGQQADVHTAFCQQFEQGGWFPQVSWWPIKTIKGESVASKTRKN
jgi:hypothetical protein